MIRSIFLSLFFVLSLATCIHAQNIADDDTRISLQQCRTIEMVLGAREQHRKPGDVFDPDDAFTLAGEKCDQLQAAISASDPAKVRSATAALRPFLASLGLPPTSPQEQLAALEKATAGSSEEDLEWKLPDLAKRAFAAGETEKAGRYAKQLLEIASRHPKGWNDYGNAIFYGNFVQGRIALQQGDLAQAGKYLLESAATPGSPQLATFGPNMTLAKELLENGKRDIVLQYLALCKNFWEDDNGKLDKWIATVKSGGTPDFGANLRY